jgi:zinc-ribbon domain
MYCPSCGKDIPDGSTFCLQCGKPISSVPAEAKKTYSLETIWKIFAALVVIIGAIFIFAYISQHNRQAGSTNPVNAILRLPLRLHRVTIGTGALTVAADSFSYYTLPVPPSASQVSLQGHLSATGGSGNDIELYVMDEDAFTNWKNGHATRTIYNSGKITVVSLNVTLPSGAGTYYLIFNNKFSLLTPKAVQEDITLTYYTP